MPSEEKEEQPWSCPTCDSPLDGIVAFDEKAAKGMTSDEVREVYPRKYLQCTNPECSYQVVAYASFSHYIAGDW